MFTAWGHFVARFRWAVLAAAVAAAAVGATWGTGVFGALSSGGFDDPNSSSSRVAAQITRQLGSQNADVLPLYSSRTLTVADPAFAGAVTRALTVVKSRPEVATVLSYYDTGSPALVSHDRHATYAVIRLRAGNDDEKLRDYRAVKDLLRAGAPVTTQLGGARAFYDDASAMTQRDIERAEMLSLPVLLVLLLVIFGSAVAAGTPLLIGGLAILGGFTVTRLLAYATDISTFAINIITLIGLGLSVDYALFVVGRFREELAAGYGNREAVARTLATAGRTVMVSGVTVTLALASLLLFPQGFLKSMAYGGMAAVLVAVVASLTVLPAGLAVLGPRVDALRVPMPWRRGRGRVDPTGAGPTTGFWAAVARSVMRRPWVYLVGVLVILAVLATPARAIRYGGIDVRVLPKATESRAANDRITAEFPGASPYPIQVLATGVDPAGISGLVGRITAVPHVTGATVAAASGGSALITVGYAGDETGEDARAVVRDIRALPPPPGATIGVTGYTASLIDQLAGLGAMLPWMLLLVVAVTMVLLFVAFGSIVLPVKAVLMNVVSIGAALGAVVFVFQQGHLASFLRFTPTGFIEPTDLILMVAVLFGLSTDYEVFLLSRVREEWDHGADNATAVSVGLQRTGRIITSAALLLMIVVAGFTTGQIAIIKLIGVGLIVAIFVDATLVRALLVPATMRLLGRWNWWAPGPLGRVYRRYGFSETADEPDHTTAGTSVR
jgi:uncharacterized membrane protein YdfJ with MMPL/SSD domain